MKKLLAVLIASAFILTACGSGGSVTNLNVEDFAAKAADPSVVVLDVRTSDEFLSGHLARAENIDYNAGNFQNDIQGLDKTRTYLVYCRSGHRSGLATEIMAKQGFTHVFNLNGGIIDWTAAGKELVKN